MVVVTTFLLLPVGAGVTAGGAGRGGIAAIVEKAAASAASSDVVTAMVGEDGIRVDGSWTEVMLEVVMVVAVGAVAVEVVVAP